ncbi:hypothetical protein [Hymenobacter volaticus]|uniref:Uncharacterized protein n=1 Tax=Hymenobacter volaticus TaxID=2932254 RepID=A0ABY4G860_9BACT|nr:hypothetical protein [Hymenobacter volaticus]UOQ66784.1 hypothetical protein MUN86_02360 [Hymenobacter volaticus]
MPNHRIHPFLHIDRSFSIYEHIGRKQAIREGDPIPATGDYVTLPLDIRPKDNVTIARKIQVNDAGKHIPVTEESVYDQEFLQRFFNPAYTVDDRIALLAEHFGRYTRRKTPESFLDYLEARIVAHARVLLGGKVDMEALWQGEDGRLLLDWIRQQRGYVQNPIAARRGKSKTQLLDTKTQLAVIYYMHLGKMWTISLKYSNELVHLLAGILTRTPNSIAPLVHYLTEPPSQENNRVLNEKYMTQAKQFFLHSEQSELAQLVEKDLMHLK